jgi:hypothetical protein
MNLKGRRIYIAGSVHPQSDEGQLARVHDIVRGLTISLATQGATFTIPFGGEPRLDGRSDGPPIIFDWTVITALHDLLKAGKITPTGPNGSLIATVSVNKNGETDRKIPDDRKDIYKELRGQTRSPSKSYLRDGRLERSGARAWHG